MHPKPFRHSLALGWPAACLLLTAASGVSVRAAAKTPVKAAAAPVKAAAAPVKAAAAPVKAAAAPVKAAAAPVKAAAAPVEALLYSTLPSTAAHRPEMALDGDTGTYFRSAAGMGDGDDFLVLLSRPIPVRSVHVMTGDADGQDLLTGGSLETSPDGAHYTKAAPFDKAGVADAAMNGTPVMALRLRLNQGQGLPALVVREIQIRSAVGISHIALGPGRGFYDTSQAPDLADWARKAEAQMEQFWPDTEALLYSDKFIPPNMVNVVYRTGPGVTDVAATGGGVMTVNSAWCRAQPGDTGLTVHETAHVIQAYSSYDPVWLVEGIADYIRWIKFEPENYHVHIDVRTATYHDSYRTTATFLAWCELHYDSGLVTKLNRAVRFGNYNNGLFKTYCGKDVDALWSEFIAAYQADPADIVTPPTAAADRPRPLPAVTPGSSAPVDLSTAFNGVGIYNDGAAADGAAGVDGEGNGYSASLLGTGQTWKSVQFRLGPANAADLVSCHGQMIPLPDGTHASLWLLATAVEGSQRTQSVTVTYTDGTTQTFFQNFSDWFQPGGFPGESRAVRMGYRLAASGDKDPRTFCLYSYGFSLNPAKTAQSVTLPSNENVKIFALTLAN